jgi:hypothetical protein
VRTMIRACLSSQPAIRGYTDRYKNMMEALQVSYIRAIAASAGCIVSEPEIDDGIDLTLTHKSDHHSHINDRVALLEVQLKATARKINASGNLTVTMSHGRWEYFSTKDPIVNKIVVIMAMPSRQDYWTYARHKSLSIHYCGYWVNIAGATDSGAAEPTIRASQSQIFSDIALCDMMERIGQGGVP